MNLTNRIRDVIESNFVPPDRRKVGVEIECLFYQADGQRIPVNPTNRFSATDFLGTLEAMQREDAAKSWYSLEPGGQLEWASPPELSLRTLQDRFQRHFHRAQEIATKQNLTQLDVSLEPIWTPDNIDLIAQKKYRLMHNMFIRTGKLGPWMMRNTTSVQVNIDYSSRQDAEEMAFIADCLQPLAAILFSHSPFYRGEPVGTQNWRTRIWSDTDPARCNHLLDHGISQTADLIKRYAEYVQTVPAIFVHDESGAVQAYSGTLGDWLSNLATEGRLTEKAIQLALHQIFTHERFKNVLEIRGADRPPFGFELAPVAWWTGLLLAPDIREKILAIVSRWSETERKSLQQAVEILELSQSGPANKSISEWLEIFGSLALKGLEQRSRDQHIPSETKYLAPLLESVLKTGPMTLQVQKKFQQQSRSVINFFMQRSEDPDDV